MCYHTVPWPFTPPTTNLDVYYVRTPATGGPAWTAEPVSRQEFDALKAELGALKALLKPAPGHAGRRVGEPRDGSNDLD